MKMEYHKLPNATLQINSLESINLEEIYSTVDSHSYACLKGLFKKEIINNSVNKLKASFNFKKDNPPYGEERKSIRNNFQKVTIGGASLRYNNYPRFFRTFYNPVWSQDIYDMREIFKNLIRLRNLIYGINKEFAVNEIEANGLWSATRIHQYPSGGGFFAVHRDSTLLDIAKEKKTNFYQIILNLTRKGKDYQSGGAFVDIDNRRYVVEDQCEIGDVLIYDGRTMHGVEEIDHDKVLNMNSLNGRIVAMASLYKV